MTTLKIQHRRHEECVLLRADYLALCQGDRCAALLLALSEHWSNVRQGMMVKEQERAERARQRGQTPKPSNGPYFYKTYADFGDDLLGLYGETAIRESLGKLVAWASSCAAAIRTTTATEPISTRLTMRKCRPRSTPFTPFPRLPRPRK